MWFGADGRDGDQVLVRGLAQIICSNGVGAMSCAGQGVDVLNGPPSGDVIQS